MQRDRHNVEIDVEQLARIPVAEQEIEIVERKGVGHPDSLCDAIANHASIALCREYKRVFGRILHNNLDKAMLVAGVSSPCIGGGTIQQAMRFIFGDRATNTHNGKSIDVEGIVVQAAKDWMRRKLRFVDPERYVIFQNEIKPGSPELIDGFDRGGAKSNDTSAAVGFAPLTPTERAVLSLENYMNSAQFKERFPETGEDIKVMAVRRRRNLHLTIAVAFVDRFIRSAHDYFGKKDEIVGDVGTYLNRFQSDFDRVELEINALDDPSRGDRGMYLTVLGTSAEGGDSGQVGRGNRANGLISHCRPQSIEAHAGKNPVNHVGKIYSYFCNHLAWQICSKVGGVREVYVHLCSQIGKSIDDPLVASLKFVLESGVSTDHVKRAAAAIVQEELSGLPTFTDLLSARDGYVDGEIISTRNILDNRTQPFELMK